MAVSASDPLRTELAFTLNEARALLALAHVIDASIGPLAWYSSVERVEIARATVQEAAPKLVERILSVSVRLERLLMLARVPPEAGLRRPLKPRR